MGLKLYHCDSKYYCVFSFVYIKFKSELINFSIQILRFKWLSIDLYSYVCVDPMNRLNVVCCGWLTEDWTNDRGKWISLNSGFIEWILHKRCIDVEIAVVVSRRRSLCWILKVCVVESLRLSCLLVCGDSACGRWGWSLEQILGVAVWSGCRCCWTQSMMWMHWLQRLDDQCPSCAVLWSNCVCVNVVSSVGASPSREVACGLDVTDAGCRGHVIDVLVCSILVNLVCVIVATNVGASPSMSHSWTKYSKCCSFGCA